MSTLAIPGIFPTSSLRRVRREEVAQPAFSQPDPFAMLMACWVDYMGTDDRDLGSRGMKLVGDAELDRDIHQEQRLADIRMGEAVNAMVDSLSIQYRWAIYRSQGISSAWRFQNANYAEVLIAARDELEKKLRAHVATRLYFT